MKLPDNLLKRLDPAWRRAILLFISTRLALTVIGILSRTLFESSRHTRFVFHYSRFALLNIWGVWDTEWYMNIARSGYSGHIHTNPGNIGQADVAFFPLYPFLSRLLGYLTRSDYVAGLILSNLCLIGAAVILYKLVRLDDDEAVGLRAILYLFVFPMAFVFSGFYTESLFLFLILSSLYCARRERWMWAGAIGVLAALTRSTGVLLVVPLLWEYLAARQFQWRRTRPEILYTLLPVLGVCLFGAECYHLTGDFLAFSHVQAGWGRHWANPLQVLWESLFSGDINNLFAGWLTLMVLILLLNFSDRLRFSYWIFGILAIAAPLCTGEMMSMPRFLLPVFPIYILLAKLPGGNLRDEILPIALALLQGCLMIFWTNAFFITI